MVSRRPKPSQAEQKRMMRHDLIHKGHWYYNYEKNSLTNGAEEVKEEAKIEMDKVGILPGGCTECLFFMMLPLEIRQKIYRLLFVRPCGIVPTYIRMKGLTSYRNTSLIMYMYQWEHKRQDGYERDNIPKFDGEDERLPVAWRSDPDAQQRALIEAGDLTETLNIGAGATMALPSYYSEELGAKVQPQVFKRGEFPVQLLNRASVISTGLQGIPFLRTNKQARAEATPILYGDNKWVFDTHGQWPFTHNYGVHNHDELDYIHKNATHFIPGLPGQDGRPMSQRQIDRAMENLFKTDVYQSAFLRRNPISKFFHEIGPVNASYITKVVIEGIFKTAEINPPYRHGRPLGLARTLPIMTTILKNACPALKEVTLHENGGADLFDDDLDEQLGMTDEERVDEIVGKVVDGLPSLQKLQLGNWQSTHDEKRVVGIWGKSFPWEKMVAEGYRCEKEEPVVQQYIWKGDKRGLSQQNDFSTLIDNALAAAKSGNGKKGKKRGGNRGEGNSTRET